MKCQKCGADIARGSSFCSACGAKVETTVAANCSVLRSIFSSSYFLAICILLSAATVLGANHLFFAALGEDHLFSALFTVACWIIYANAKSQTDPVRQTGYKFLYIVTKVQYIIQWVVAAIIAVSGVVGAVLIIASRPLALSLLGAAVEYSADISDVLSDVAAFVAGLLSSAPVTAVIALLMLLSMVACAALISLYNGLIMRRFVKYFEGIMNASVNGDGALAALDHSRVSVCMLINGILILLPGISNVMKLNLHTLNGTGTLCLAAVCFVAYAMIREYMKNSSTDKAN